MVAIDDVVVPVSLTRLKCRALESECPFPRTGFRGCLVLGEWKLSSVSVPRSEEVNGLDAGRGAQTE